MKVIAIAAVGRNGVIGKEKGLPWDIPEDMNFFKSTTRNHIVVMGRKTFDCLGKPLPARENAVITRDPSWNHSGVKVFQSLESAIHFYQQNAAQFSGKNLFVIGGAEIYRLSLPLLDEVWLTEINTAFEGDVFFPFYENGNFQRPEFRRAVHNPQLDFSSSPHQYFFNQYLRVK